MEQYVDTSRKILYIAGSWGDLIEYVATDRTEDLKRELTARDEKIGKLQERIAWQFNIIQGYKAQVDVLTKENTDIKSSNDRQFDTITCYQDKTEALYKENMILKMKNDAFADENKSTDLLQTQLQHEILEVRKENETLKTKNAQLIQDNENLTKRISLLRVVDPSWAYKIY